MKRTIRNLVVTSALAAACAMPLFASVTTDYDHSANFRSYHTFSFMKIQSDDPFVDSRLRAEMTKDLGKAGWSLVPDGGDVQITAVEAEHDVKQYNTFYDGLGGGGYGWGRGGWRGGFGGGFGGGGFGESSTVQQDIPVGTLLVDMYDSQTHQIIFRGRATSQLSSKADKNTKKFDKDIDHILNGFPPPTKG